MAGAIDHEAQAVVESLAVAARRLGDLAVEAAEFDERASAVAQRERELDELAVVLADAHARQIARAAELDDQERALSQQRTAVAEQRSVVAVREAVTKEMQEELLIRARALEERTARVHWRWFVRAWSWRPRLPAANARICELFFVPTPGGYKLLEQTGVAVAPRARLTGLIDERSSYTVTKVAQLPFDGRWCAYLEINHVSRRRPR